VEEGIAGLYTGSFFSYLLNMDDLLTAMEAATRVGISPVTINKAIKEGVLIPKGRAPGRGQFLLDPQDIDAFAAVWSNSMSPVQIARMAMQAFASSRTTERALRQLLDLLGANIPVIFPEKESLQSLVEDAKRQLKRPGLPTVPELLYWAKMLYALGEEHMLLIEKELGISPPYTVFTGLAEKLCQGVAELSVVDKEMEMVYGYLMMSRRNLRNVVYMYARGKGEKVDVDVHEEIITLMFP